MLLAEQVVEDDRPLQSRREGSGRGPKTAKFTAIAIATVLGGVPATSDAAPPAGNGNAGVIDHGPTLVPVGSPVYTSQSGARLVTLDSFSEQLADGDRINIVVEASDLPKDQVELRLRTQTGMWFKGVEVHKQGAVNKLETENGGTTGFQTLRKADLGRRWLVFVKAKAFGVHTPVYELPGGRLKELLGKRITFDWMKD